MWAKHSRGPVPTLDEASDGPHPAQDVRAALTSLLVLANALPAQAQVIPDPPAAPRSAELSDDDLIRWASNEVRIHEGRPRSRPRPPIPPASYIGADVEGPVSLPHEGERDAVRLLAELGGGALGVLVGGAVAMLVVWAAIEADANPDWMLVAVGTGATLGAFAVTGGVVLGADAAGGRGTFGDAFIGQLIGSVAALPLVTLGMMNDAPAVAIVSAGLLPLCGAILGYEISHANRSTTRQLAYVRPIPGGATVGVAGEVP